MASGYPPLSPQLARYLVRAYVRSPDGASPSVELTVKEREVLKALATGNRVSEAAEQLGVTKNTIQTHVRRVYSKLNISSRAEATAVATRIGLI
jgi:DNA-binding NarL/FixJ family response regulator